MGVDDMLSGKQEEPEIATTSSEGEQSKKAIIESPLSELDKEVMSQIDMAMSNVRDILNNKDLFSYFSQNEIGREREKIIQNLIDAHIDARHAIENLAYETEKK